MPPRTSTAGFTMLEALIVVVLMGLSLSALGMVTRTTQDAFEASAAGTELDSKGLRALSEVKDLLRSAVASEITPRLAAPFSSDFVEFRSIADVAGGVLVLGTLERLALEPAPGELLDGQDNDGNGLADDHHLVYYTDFGGPDVRRRVILTRIPRLLQGEDDGLGDENGNGLDNEAGLAIESDGATLVLRLSVQRPVPRGTPLTRTLEATVRPRN